MTNDKRNFYRGMLAALAVVAHFDSETIYREIVNTANEADLIRVAKEDEGTVEWAGLAKYGYVRGVGEDPYQ